MASSSLELFAIVGEWGLAAAGVTEIGGLAVASIASAFTILAGFAAIAGMVLLLVLAFRPQKSPIQKFAEGPAKEAGFYMQDKASLDALNISGATGGDTPPQLVGVALEVGNQRDKALTFKNDNTLTLSPQALNFSTSFFLVSDALGRAVFTSLLSPGGTTELGTPRQTAVNIVLGDDKVLKSAAPITDSARLLQQSWVSEYAGNPQWDNGALVAADFRFYNAYWAQAANGGVKYYLDSDGTSVRVTQGSGNAWTVALTTMYPSQMAMQDISLWDYQRDQRFLPYLGQPGSAPRTWTLTPSLPSFMGFDATSGAIFQQAGVAPRVMDSQSYTLTVTNQYGKAEVSFKLRVLHFQPLPPPPHLLG